MSFLRDYLQYTEGDEAPRMFHVWSGYACLSAAIFRKVWMVDGDKVILPNIYVMLVGDAGNGKSSAMDNARRLLADVDNVFVAGSVETPQGMIRFMGGNDKAEPPLPAHCRFPAKWADGNIYDTHCITIIANEFINFISLMPQEWINVLNDIYDRDKYHYRTKAGGEDIIVGPYITMLAALTTDISIDLQKARIISSGLARRTLFQYGERQFNNPKPRRNYTPEHNAAKARAIQRLRELGKIGGEFKWGVGAAEWFDEWYAGNSRAIPKKSPQIRSWFTSKSVQLQKLAMLTSLADGDSLLVEVDHFKVALELLENLELDLYKIFGGSGRNELTGIGIKIVEYLTGLNEVVFWKTIYAQHFHMFDKRDPLKDFEATITFLKDTGQIAELMASTTSTSTPVRLIGLPSVATAFASRTGQAPPQPPVVAPNGSRPGA